MNLSEVEKFLDDWPNNGEMTPQERIKRLGEILDVYSRATGRPFRFEFFYGGEKYPDDEGHGHVVCNNEEGNVIYWKLPIREGGYVVIDERDGGEPIRF